MSKVQDTSSVAQKRPPTWVEWGARLMSLALVASLLGFVVLSGLQSTQPPVFEHTIERHRIEERAGSWVVPVLVKNAGTVSVSQLGITLELIGGGGQSVDSETVTIELLGRGAEREVAFWFGTDPANRTMRFDVDSYRVP